MLGISKTHFIHAVDQKIEQMTKSFASHYNSRSDQYTTSNTAPITNSNNNNGDDSSVSSAGLNNDVSINITNNNDNNTNNNNSHNRKIKSNNNNNNNDINNKTVKLLKRPHTAAAADVNLQSIQVNEQLKESIMKQKARNTNKVRPSTGGIHDDHYVYVDIDDDDDDEYEYEYEYDEHDG